MIKRLTLVGVRIYSLWRLDFLLDTLTRQIIGANTVALHAARLGRFFVVPLLVARRSTDKRTSPVEEKGIPTNVYGIPALPPRPKRLG